VPVWIIENAEMLLFTLLKKGKLRLAGDSGPRTTSSAVGSWGPTISTSFESRLQARKRSTPKRAPKEA
jgi:hypothetical protein